MKRISYAEQRSDGVAFVGTYLPRPCGIATFTYDLAEALAEGNGHNQRVIVAAMNDQLEGYDYPRRVELEIGQERPLDYRKAAEYLNAGNIGVVSLQHEFGIFGGNGGSHVLTLLDELTCPVIVTCHTVKENTDPIKKEVLTEICYKADKLVVMSEKAFDILENVYGAHRNKIAHIPHGIHDTPLVDPGYYKGDLGLKGRKVLLTFGLLHRHKGIEYMIDALPAIVQKHPEVIYVVLGATHPKVLQREGDSYRLGLVEQVMKLGLQKHVLFHNKFVELDELLQYLGATDILVTPYTKLDQITSGVLPYAMGRGRAVVSTPYWHAEELLADGRGRLVPERDSAALAREINNLLDDGEAMSAVCENAYSFTRSMTWPAVARSYLALFGEVRTRAQRIASLARSLPGPFSVAESFPYAARSSKPYAVHGARAAMVTERMTRHRLR